MRIINNIIALLVSCAAIPAMAADVYPIMIKETQFVATGPEQVATNMVNWNAELLAPASAPQRLTTEFHLESGGGVDLVRINYSSSKGNFTTLHALWVEMVTKPVAGLTTNDAIATAMKQVAADHVINPPASFSFTSESDGVKYFSASAGSKYSGLYYNGIIAITKVKEVDGVLTGADVELNRQWFNRSGKSRVKQ